MGMSPEMLHPAWQRERTEGPAGGPKKWDTASQGGAFRNAKAAANARA